MAKKGSGKGYLWILEQSKREHGNECVLWPFSLDAYGYGQFGYNGRTYKAHRFSYELNRGPIVNDLHVCHTCDVRNCVNPAHLFLATNAENTADKMAKGRYGTGQGAPPGEGHGRSKLRNEDVLAIRASSEKIADIAARYGVSYSHVWRLRHGYNWVHLHQQDTPK